MKKDTYSQRVPKGRAVEHLASRRNGNPDEAEECEDNGDDDELDVGHLRSFGVTGEVIAVCIV